MRTKIKLKFSIYKFKRKVKIMAKIYRNNKNKKLYEILTEDLINCTNANDGQEMVLYVSLEAAEKKFCREKKEFFEKFTKAEK